MGRGSIGRLHRGPLVVLLVSVAACGGDGDAQSTTPSSPTVPPVTSAAPDPASTSPTTAVPTSPPTTEAPPTTDAPPTTPPDPALTTEPGAIVAEVRAGEVSVRRADGRTEVVASGVCVRPSLALTLDGLALACEPELHLVGFDDGTVSTLESQLPTGWASQPNVGPVAGDTWVSVCVPTDDDPSLLGECTVVSTADGSVLAVDVPTSTRLSGAGSLLHASMLDGRLTVTDVDTAAPVLEIQRSPDRSSDRLARLPDGSVALEAGFTTEGDSRPERLELRDPRTDDPLGIDDGADLLPLTGLGLSTLRPVDGVVVQPGDVVAQDPSGAELWSVDDRDTVAIAAPPRLWLATPGSPAVTEVDPATGEPVATIELPGPLVDAVVPVRATSTHLVLTYEDGFADVVAVIAV